MHDKSSFARARQRLGAQDIETVFRKLAGPLAPAGLEGSFYRGMRLAAVDGFRPGRSADAAAPAAARRAEGRSSADPVVCGRPADRVLARRDLLARMNLAGQKRAAPGHVVLRVIEYQAGGGETIRLLTGLPGPRHIRPPNSPPSTRVRLTQYRKWTRSKTA